MIFRFKKNPILLVSFAILLASSIVAQPLTRADQMPYFPGCDHLENDSKEKRNCSNQGVVAFIGNYLQYPDLAKAEQLEGTVYVSFVVEENGSVSKQQVLRDIGGGCGDAALEVLQKMPPWEPAIHQGKQVAVKLNLPVQFSFQIEDKTGEGGYKIHWSLLKGNQINRQQLEEASYKKVQVRDVYGNEVPISELLFSFEKNRTYLDAKSNGKLTKAMTKVIRRTRKGGLFSIVATVQKDGEFVYVERVFEVVEE